ncbi:high affinity copper uptake protein 1 isoform X1 [Drosophila kikkawai]|uniref:Copper transport protein n=1 Tax=Drosophila kikkawai TaxID=30033 RepID=A0A6P4HX59_DROKI|nr:uncharacterized protein LOC108073685 isoform X1 [Drosophila kikkawai]
MFDGPSGVLPSPEAQFQHHESHGSHGGDVVSSHEGHGSPAMSHHGHGVDSHGDHGGGEGGGGHMMAMAFHTGYTETILFNFWRTQSAMALGLSCLLIFLVAVLYEGLKFYREWLIAKTRDKRLDAGGDQNDRGRRYREPNYGYKPASYSYRLSPPQQQAQGQVPAYAYRPPPSAIQPHQHNEPIGSPPGPPAQMIPAQHHHHLPQGPGHHHIQEPQVPDGDRKVPWRRRWFSRLHIIQTFLHILQVLISFLLMLVFMTFNVWLCMAVVLGAGVGYYIFCAFSNRINEHCN